MGDVEYEYHLGPEDYFRARYTTDGNDVLSFSVQYETYIDGEWREVTHYDTHHGVPHQDTYDRARRQHKSWALAEMNYNEALFFEALFFALNDIRTNWLRYKTTYLRSAT